MAHPDLDQLLNALMSMVDLLLKEQGTFLHIGAIIWSDGTLQYVGAKIEGDDYPAPEPLIDLMMERFQTSASEGRLRAAGICFDGLEHFPYRCGV